MGYAQLISQIIGAIGGIVASNQIGGAIEGYDTQLKKYKTFEPKEPDAPKTIDWRSIFNTVLGTNLQQTKQREQLARGQNTFNLAESKRLYGSMQPFFDSLNKQIGTNALSYSKGELPADVVASIGRSSASRGLQSGFGQGARGGGTGTSLGSLNLRNLGLTSLQLSQYGTQTAMEANKLAKYLSPELADSTAWYLTPQQGIGYEAANVGIENEAARYWNELQNSALLSNTNIANQANQMSAEGKLAARLARAKIIADSTSSSGGGGGGSFI